MMILGLGESGGIMVVFSVLEASVGKALSLLLRVSYTENSQ
jgi:hypothetical protein